MDALDKADKQLKAVFNKRGIDADNTVNTYDVEWRQDAKLIKEMILREGVPNTFGAFLEALQLIEKDRGNLGGEAFYESEEYLNLRHCQQAVSHVMAACDFDIEHSHSETRNAEMDQLKENISELETQKLFNKASMIEFEAEKLGVEAYRNGESFNSNPFDRDKEPDLFHAWANSWKYECKYWEFGDI